MAYTINNTNGDPIATIPDGTINTSTDLTLIGKNYAGYGEKQNENFVFLLENFCNESPPAKPVAGELWFNKTTTALKINVYDGVNWKTLAVTNITTPDSPGLPSEVTVGDMWYDQDENKLRVFNGTDYTLVGPQSVLGSGQTQMESVKIKDTLNQDHPVQLAWVNGGVLFILSSDDEFIPLTPISGFSNIYRGITLSSDKKLFGTATNADKLGGEFPNYYAPINNPNFPTEITVNDAGVNIGTELSIFNNLSNIPVIKNNTGDTISFQTTTNTVVDTPLQLVGKNIVPGEPTNTDLGSLTKPFKNVYAGYMYATAQKADTLSIAGNYAIASTVASTNTIAARDSQGHIVANRFVGLADEATQAALAIEANHAATADLAVEANLVQWNNIGSKPLNFVYEDNNASAWKINISGNSVGVHTGTVLGNVTGNLTGVTTGTHNGVVYGNVTGTIHTATEKFIGNLQGNVTGNLVGNTNGLHTGPVTGNVTGSLYATDNTQVFNSASKQIGYTNANIVGNLSGNATGAVHTATDHFQGNIFGNVTGNVTGNLIGNTSGTHTGPVTGNVTGDTTGLHTGPVTGIVTGSLVGNATSATNQSGGTVNATTGSFSQALTVAAGASFGVRFPNNAFGGGGDTAAITLETKGGEATTLTLRVTNDSDDTINFVAPTNSGVTVNSNIVLHAANFNGYSPTLTGVGASGTWGITVSGTSTGVANRGNITAESDGTAEPANQLTLRSVYNNGYPTTYGNLITLGGVGGGELLVGWSGTTGAHADNYIRSRRDVGTTWSPWAKVITSANAGDALAPVATTNSYNSLIDKPTIPAPTASPKDQLQNIVDTIVGSIDVYSTSNPGASGYRSGYITADNFNVTYGGWQTWATSYGGTQTAASVWLGQRDGTVRIRVSLPQFLGLSDSVSSLYWKGNYEFNVHTGLTRVADRRNVYYNMGPANWFCYVVPVTADKTSSYYGQFDIYVGISDESRWYHGSNVQAGWIGLASRQRNVYEP